MLPKSGLQRVQTRCDPFPVWAGKTASRHDRNAMFWAGHHQVPALRRALSSWWRQIGDTACRCAYESGLQVKGKLIPAENRGMSCRQAAHEGRGAADRSEYREA